MIGGPLQYTTGLAVDRSGAAIVVGSTSATDFPLERPIDSTLGGYLDAFVFKVTPDGQALVFSTYLGGTGSDSANDVVLDRQGRIVIAGDTSSLDVPVWFGARRQDWDQGVLIAALSADGQQMHAIGQIGGAGYDTAAAIDVDEAGSLYVAGTTGSADFPTRNALQSGGLQGDEDAFLLRLDFPGPTLVYSTYLGGRARERLSDLVAEPDGSVTIAGSTESFDFPLRDPFQRTFGGPVLSVSDDGGGSWRSVVNGPNVSIVTSIAPLADPNALIIGTDLGLFRSLDGGASWNAAGPPVGATYIRDVAADPIDSSIVYAAGDGGLVVSRDSGDTWQSVGPTPCMVRDIEVARSQHETVFATGCGFLKSTDAGRAWVAVAMRAWRSIAVDPRDASVIYASDWYVYKSVDGGSTWVRLTPPAPPWEMEWLDIDIEVNDPRVLYIVSWSKVLVSREFCSLVRGLCYRTIPGWPIILKTRKGGHGSPSFVT